MITQEQMKEILLYNEITGELTWKKKISSKVVIGKIAGSVIKGYKRIKIDSIIYEASHIVWLIHYGYWPKEIVDHIDRNTLNNKIDNLREVTKQENAVNAKKYRRRKNRDLPRGVYRYKTKVFIAMITVKGETRRLGSFKTVEEAEQAYKQAAREAFGDLADER